MTDRYHSLTVVLEKDTRSDDAESLIKAIEHMRGIVSVGGNVSGINSFIAESRVRTELATQLWNVLYPPKKDQ